MARSQENELPTPLARLKQAARLSGMRLLDADWAGWQAQRRLRCKKGHVWSRSATHIIYEAPLQCPECRKARLFATLVAAVRKNGSVCLDTAWQGFTQHYRFRCAAGHEWHRSARQIREKGTTTCPHCQQRVTNESKRLTDGLKRLRAAAAAKGGVCLADAYEGGTARYRFRCRRGHEWEAAGAEVLRGSWCLPCSHEDRRTQYRDVNGLARLREAAAARGGKCLSKTYTGQAAHYRFRCARGHAWEAKGHRILLGNWCPQCSYDAKRDNLAVFQALAAEHGGECLSKVYRNSTLKLTWRCRRGHVWKALPGNVKQGHWCRQCECERRRTDIAVFHDLARERGGACLSESYQGVGVKLTWRCHRGHVWQALPGHIKRGHWCPECANANKITRRDSKARMRYTKAGAPVEAG